MGGRVARPSGRLFLCFLLLLLLHQQRVAVATVSLSAEGQQPLLRPRSTTDQSSKRAEVGGQKSASIQGLPVNVAQQPLYSCIPIDQPKQTGQPSSDFSQPCLASSRDSLSQKLICTCTPVTQQSTSSSQQFTCTCTSCTSTKQQLITQQPSIQQPVIQKSNPVTQQPTPADRYVLVLDAGSTGTRANVMRFHPDSNHSAGMRLASLHYESFRPGLSAFRHFPQRVAGHLEPLLKFAARRIPPEARAQTPVLLGATAGLRSLPSADQGRLMAAVKRILALWGGAGNASSSAAGIHTRILTGAEEAQFGWLSVNFLMDSLRSSNGAADTYGLLDMGGGSTQIIFLPEEPVPNDPDAVRFRTLGGREFNLHQHSYSTLGSAQATLDLLGHSEDNGDGHYVTPCLAANFSTNFSFGAIAIVVHGDHQVGDAERFEWCSSQHLHLLQAAKVHAAPVTPSTRFVAVSSFYYVASTYNRGWPHGIHVPANLTVGYLEAAARNACHSPSSTGQYAPYACINLVHISNLLTKGYAFSPDQVLYVTDKIGGHSANWPMGLAVHWLTSGGEGGDNGTEAGRETTGTRGVKGGGSPGRGGGNEGGRGAVGGSGRSGQTPAGGGGGLQRRDEVPQQTQQQPPRPLTPQQTAAGGMSGQIKGSDGGNSADGKSPAPPTRLLPLLTAATPLLLPRLLAPLLETGGVMRHR